MGDDEGTLGAGLKWSTFLLLTPLDSSGKPWAVQRVQCIYLRYLCNLKIMIADIKKSAEQKMQKSLEALKLDLGKVRTGRAHTGLAGSYYRRLLWHAYAHQSGRQSSTWPMRALLPLRHGKRRC